MSNEAIVSGEFTPRGARCGTFWIDASEMGASDCDLCGDPHYFVTCPACGAQQDEFQQEAPFKLGCWCGVTLWISAIAADEFRRMHGG
jgi:hypothetical protein